MFILVNKLDMIIIGSAINNIDEKDCNSKGLIVFEIPDDEFYADMLGMKIINFESNE